MKNKLKFSSSAKDYAAFVNSYSQSIALKKLSREKINGVKDFGPVFNLIDSMSSLALADAKGGSASEWNPFSQRVWMAVPGILEGGTTAQDLAYFTDRIKQFIYLAHESLHILLLEPIFTGHMKKAPTLKSFTDASLVFEAFCFWYADIIITRRLRIMLSDGEFVFSRNSVSSQYVHPYRVFQAIGVKKEIDILKIYFKAFLGYRTELLANRKNPLVSELSNRFLGSHVESIKPLNLLFSELKKIGFYDDYIKRFCSRKGLPSLLPNEVLNIDVFNDSENYCLAINKVGFGHLQKLSPEEINRIRLRRHIQTRAYYSFSLISAINSNEVFSKTGKLYDATEILRELNNYNDQLEMAIESLCSGMPTEALFKNLENIDQRYSKNVRAKLQKSDLWISGRILAYPNFKTKSSRFGLQSKNEVPTLQNIKALTNKLINDFYLPLTKNATNALAEDRVRMAKKYLALLMAVKNANIKKWKTAFNDLLLEDGVLQLWSVSLAEIDPERNRFREILFWYE